MTFRAKPREGAYTDRLKSPGTDDAHGGTNDQYPVFCLHHWINASDCDKDDRASLVEKLRLLSQLTWQEIQSKDKHSLGCERVPRKCIKIPLPNVAERVERLHVFRYHAKFPMICMREGATLRILYLDRNHTAY